MTILTKIGNSQGIRIPKPLIKKAGLEDSEIELEIVEGGLLLRPVKKSSRKKWEENIKQTIEKNKGGEDEAYLEDMLDDSDLEDLQW